VDKYTWVDVGSSYLPSDLLAAMLLAQLEQSDWVQDRRRALWEKYDSDLVDWAEENDARLPFVPPHCGKCYHLFHMLLPTADSRDRLITHLRSRGILAVFHYQPLHRSPYAHRISADSQCSVTEDVSARLIRLPFFTNMALADADEVIAAVREFRVTG
jgi:dTDP-4-amino-4,6-dideoxygalactose transaminase